MKDYPTITISKRVGCGYIFCRFLEEDSTFHKLLISGDMAKTCECGESWLVTIAKLITFSLRRSLWEGTTEKGIIKQLLNQRCPNTIANKEHIVSCADAIGRAVLDYVKKEKETTQTQEKTNS